MFTEKEFTTLYEMLDLSFFALNDNIDCGSTQFSNCQRFCCIGNSQKPTPTKWLLPNEEKFLQNYHFEQHAKIQNYGYMTTYSSFDTTICPCENARQHRPFCCRIFPFRPLLDVTNRTVANIARSKSNYLSPCWLTQPSSLWKKRAIQAWQFVLSDLDNLCFFAQFHLIIQQSEKQPGVLFSEALKDSSFSSQMNALPYMALDELWNLSSKYFLFSLS